MRLRNLLLLAPLCCPALSAHAQFVTYNDPRTGVTFQYPSVWKQVDMAQSLLVENSSLQPIVVFEFSPKGNLYEKTNLTGLDFFYFTAPTADAAACAKLGDVTGGDPPKPTTVTIHGVSFQHSKGSDAGMSHQMGSDVYSTYRNGVCYLFEEVFGNVAPGVIEGAHNLTVTQTKALQRHLDAITQSIVFTMPKP